LVPSATTSAGDKPVNVLVVMEVALPAVAAAVKEIPTPVMVVELSVTAAPVKVEPLRVTSSIAERPIPVPVTLKVQAVTTAPFFTATLATAPVLPVFTVKVSLFRVPVAVPVAFMVKNAADDIGIRTVAAPPAVVSVIVSGPLVPSMVTLSITTVLPVRVQAR